MTSLEGQANNDDISSSNPPLLLDDAALASGMSNPDISQRPPNLPQNNPYSDIANIAFCVFIGVIFLVLFALCFFIFGSEGDYHNMVGVVQHISTNLATPPILDVVGLQHGSCPSGYKVQTLGKWPGTREGCYCRYPNHLYYESCRAANKTHCETIYPRSSETLNRWLESQFCVKTYQKFEIASYGSCYGYFKKCGSSLCVPEEDPCPVTDLSIEYTNLYIPETTVSELGYGRYLRIIRDENKQPLVDLLVSFEDLPCLDSTASLYRYNTHGLLSESYGSCGKYGVDKEAKVLNTVAEEEVYRYNGILEKMRGVPTYLESITGKKAHLVAQSRLAQKDYSECYRIDYKRVHEIGQELSSVYGWFNFIIILSLIFSIIAGVLPAFSDLKYLKLRFHPTVIAFTGLQLFLFFICWLAVSGSCTNLISQHAQLQSLTRFSCFSNENASQALKDITEEIPKAAENIPTYLMILIGINLIGIGASYFDLVIEKLERDKKKLQ